MQYQIKVDASYYLSIKTDLSFVLISDAAFCLPTVVLNSGIIFNLFWLMALRRTYVIDFILDDYQVIASSKHFFQDLTHLDLFCCSEFLCYVTFCLGFLLLL